MKLKMIATLAIALVATAGAGATGGSSLLAEALPGSGKTASPVRPNWDSFWFGQYIMDIGMERLGYEVESPKTLSAPALFAALSQNDSDYTADTLVPNHNAMYAKVKDTVMRIGPVMDPGSLQGYLIDKRTSEKHGIHYVEDLLKPEVAALFDSDGDGRADMIGPSVGWGAEKVALHQFKALGLDKTVRMVQGEYNALSADAAGRLSAGEPVLLYAWYPNPTTLKLRPGKDLVWLQMRQTHLPDDQAESYRPLPGVVGCAGGSDPCNIGWLPTIYYIAVNRGWAEDNPAAVSFFTAVQMHLKDRVEQNTRMANGENREADIRRHAERWIADNQQTFDKWIAEAIKTANGG